MGDLDLVSNSLTALERVIDTVKGKSPRLSDGPDFQFMLARDTGKRADAFAFMGERFVAQGACFARESSGTRAAK